MEPQIQNQNPVQNPTQEAPINIQNNTPMETPNKSSGIGSIIGTIVIIAIIILGGLYFWGKRIEDAKMKQDLVSEVNTESQTEPTVNEAAAIKSISPSDDLNSIEADLNGTNLNDLDAEINPQLQ